MAEKTSTTRGGRDHVFMRRGSRMVHHPPAAHQAHGANTANFRVSYDPSLGADGPAIANAILATCEQDYLTLQGYFGDISPANRPFHIIVTTGNQGASHLSCEGTEISIGARSAPGLDLGFMRQLVIAEEDEVFEANFGHGWNCGFSNGEGLSRVLANDLVPGVEPDDFVSSHVWLDTPGRPDFVNETLQTDTDYPSIGCSVLFLNWLRFQLGFSWRDIIAQGAPTLAGTYSNLTGQNDGWQRFRALMEERFPSGTPSGLTTDNPFPFL